MGQRPEQVLSKLGKIVIGSPALAMNAWRFAARGLTPAIRPRRIYLEVFSEQAPDRDSRICLGENTDSFGQRQMRINWRLGQLDWRTLLVFVHSVRAEFARLGLGRVQPAEWLTAGIPAGAELLDSYHPAGTTRMGLTAREGVVDINSQVFGVDGLYVAGSSVFPTSGAVNPVLTITAMSVRLSERLKSAVLR